MSWPPASSRHRLGTTPITRAGTAERRGLRARRPRRLVLPAATDRGTEVSHSLGYARPRQLSEAFDVLEEFVRDASLLACGTDLVVGLLNGRVATRMIVDLKRISGLDPVIEEREGRVSISAPTRLTDIITDPRIQDHFPALVEAASTVGSVQIRNRATLTGNICNASPAADTAPALLAYGAGVVLISRHGTRLVPLDKFLLRPTRPRLCTRQLAAALEIPQPRGLTGTLLARLTRRRGVDLATISLCCVVGSRVTRFAYGAVSPKPLAMSDGSGVLP